MHAKPIYQRNVSIPWRSNGYSGLYVARTGAGAACRSSFGSLRLRAIVYEMLSGQRAFRGDSPADTMSAILREDPPDLSATNRNVSPALERLVDHCLEKNPEERFHSARDLAFALEALSGSTVSATETVTMPAITPRRLGRRELISWSLAALFLITAVAFAIVALRSATSTKDEELSRFYVYAPENTKFGGATDFISPDGRKLIFNVVGADQKEQLWIRSFDSLTARPIPGTEGGGARLLVAR